MSKIYLYRLPGPKFPVFGDKNVFLLDTKTVPFTGGGGGVMTCFRAKGQQGGGSDLLLLRFVKK